MSFEVSLAHPINFNKAADLMSNNLKATLNRLPGFMSEIYKTYINHLLEYAVRVWATGYSDDLVLLKTVKSQVYRVWTIEQECIG